MDSDSSEDGRVKMKKKNIHNREYLREKRKHLRSNSTSAEATLWNALKGKQLFERKFRRQHSILNYIVDFYCSSEKLIIELDGAVHLDFGQQNYDYERTEKLEQLGYKLIRFENKEVFESLEFVLDEIRNHFKS